MNTSLNQASHRLQLTCALLLGSLVFAGCGDDDDPRVFIESPLAGASFTAANDADPAMAGIQLDVEVLVENEREGAEVWLYTDAGILMDDPEAEPMLVETLPDDGRVTFRPTLAPGTHELLACVGECEFRSQQVRITVTESCAGITYLDPAPADAEVTRLGPDDDIDGEACGGTFTTNVRVSTSAPEGTSFQLFVNGTPSTTAEAVGGQLTFASVVLVPGNNTLAIEATLPTAESCTAPFPTGLEVDCDGTSCMITLPAPGRSVLNSDDDVSAAEGFQADFEITAGSDAIGESFNLIVDGEILTATSVGSGGAAVASFDAIDLSEGRHSVVAECFDNVGNETRTSPAEWIVDTVGCDISVEEPMPDTLFIDEDDTDPGTEGIQISTTGTVGGVGCESVAAGVCGSGLDPLDLSGTEFAGTATLASAAMQELCVVVTDDAGNETEARIPLRVRTDAPQLEIVTPSGPTAYNLLGTDGRVADLNTSNDTCEAEFIVNCTGVGEDVTIEARLSGTVFATATCEAMAGLPVPYTGRATFPSVSLPSRDNGTSVDIVARQEVDRLVGSSAPIAITPDCAVPTLAFFRPTCGGVIQPDTDDTDPGTPGVQAFIEVSNQAAYFADMTTVTTTTSGGAPVNEETSSMRFGDVIRFFDYDLGAGGELVLQACATDLAGNVGCSMSCPVTVADLPTINISSPVMDVPLNASDDCDGATPGLQVTVTATTDAADGSTARIIFGSNPAVATTVSGGTVSACVDADEGAMVPVRVEVDGMDGTGSAMVAVDVDSQAPTEAIDDLALDSVVDRRGGMVRMTWTAVADTDGGALESTEIRCSTSDITNDAQWDAAETRLVLSPSASPSSVLSEDVGGFRLGVSYFCAARSIDLGGVPTPLAGTVPVQLDFMEIEVTMPSSMEMGWGVNAIGDIDNDLIPDFAITGAGEVYIYFGRTTPMSSEQPDITIQGGADIGGRLVLGNVEGLGDFNGDTIADFAIASRADNSVFVFFGRTDRAAWGTTPIAVGDGLCSANVLCIRGEDSADSFGSRAKAVGDFNGDGISDLGIGAITAESTLTGRAYVVLGSTGFGAMSDVSVTGLQGFRISSTLLPERQFIGRGITGMGDLTADGRADIFVSGNGAATIPTSGEVRRVNGRAYVGPGLDSIEWDSLPLVASGSAGGFGTLLVNLGDVDDNGTPDLGVAQAVGAGRLHVYTGESVFASSFTIQNGLPSSGADNFSDSVGTGLHPYLGAIGQIDEASSGTEILVGARQTSGDPGDGRLYYGPTSTAQTRSSADVVLQPAFTGGDTADFARVGFIGDVNGDGHADMAVGQPNWTTGTLSGNPGRVVIYY